MIPLRTFIIVSALDDWVQLLDVLVQAIRLSPDHDRVTAEALTIATVNEMIAAGEITSIGPYPPGDETSWPLARDAVSERLRLIFDLPDAERSAPNASERMLELMDHWIVASESTADEAEKYLVDHQDEWDANFRMGVPGIS